MKHYPSTLSSFCGAILQAEMGQTNIKGKCIQIPKYVKSNIKYSYKPILSNKVAFPSCIKGNDLEKDIIQIRHSNMEMEHFFL